MTEYDSKVPVLSDSHLPAIGTINSDMNTSTTFKSVQTTHVPMLPLTPSRCLPVDMDTRRKRLVWRELGI